MKKYFFIQILFLSLWNKSKKMKISDLKKGVKVQVELKAQVIFGNEENKIVEKTIESAEKIECDFIVTFKGSKTKYKATNGWMKPLDIDGDLYSFDGKLKYIVRS